MPWMRAHVLLVASTAAIVLVATVAVRERTGVAMPANGAGQGFPVSSSYAVTPAGNAENGIAPQNNLLQNVTGEAPFSYTAPSVQRSAPVNAAPAAPGAAAREPAPAAVLQSGSEGHPSADSAFDPYSLIPRGIIKVSISSTARDSGQQALFDYGNRIGARIQSFDSAHADAVSVLKSFFDDRTNQSKAAAVARLGNDYRGLGEAIANTVPIPSEAAALNAALADSYKAVASGLVNVSKQQSEKDVTDAVVAYDTAAETFVKNYVALVDFFSARGVTFSSSDPGSVFTFKPTML